MMTEEQQETIVNEALRKFCTYLNRWWDSEDANKGVAERSPYTIEKFTVYEPERELYGSTLWNVLEEAVEGCFFQTALIKINADDGDDGGGNILYVGLEGGDTPDSLQISWIVHIFDLSPTFIYSSEAGFRSPPNGNMVKT